MLADQTGSSRETEVGGHRYIAYRRERLEGNEDGYRRNLHLMKKLYNAAQPS